MRVLRKILTVLSVSWLVADFYGIFWVWGHEPWVDPPWYVPPTVCLGVMASITIPIILLACSLSTTPAGAAERTPAMDDPEKGS